MTRNYGKSKNKVSRPWIIISITFCSLIVFCTIGYRWNFASNASSLFGVKDTGLPDIPITLEKKERLTKKPVDVNPFQLIRYYPHDTKAFTEGFLFDEGYYYESTGTNGASYIRKFSDLNKKFVKEYKLENKYFGEGIAILGDKLYSLTYTSKKGFILDKKNLTLIDEFDYSTSTGEGWGMTTDGKYLIVSDGSNNIDFWDPNDDMKKVKRIQIQKDNQPVNNINELEYVDGELYANVWYKNIILRIDIKTGNVIETIDLEVLFQLVSGLNKLTSNQKNNAVMNGIAFDPKKKSLFITGKFWDKIFEITTNNLNNKSL